jgi:hypothetical protein
MPLTCLPAILPAVLPANLPAVLPACFALPAVKINTCSSYIISWLGYLPMQLVSTPPACLLLHSQAGQPLLCLVACLGACLPACACLPTHICPAINLSRQPLRSPYINPSLRR